MLCDILGKQFTLQYCTSFKYLVPGQLQIIQNEMFSLLINFINKCILSVEKTDLAINIIMVSMEMFNYHIFVHIHIQKKTCRSAEDISMKQTILRKRTLRSQVLIM